MTSRPKVPRAVARYLLTELHEREAKMAARIRELHPEYPDWQIAERAAVRALYEMIGVLSYYAEPSQ